MFSPTTLTSVPSCISHIRLPWQDTTDGAAYTTEFHSSEGWEPKTTEPAWLVSRVASPVCLTGFSCPFVFIRTPVCSDQGGASRLHLTVIISLKALVLHTVTLGVRAQHMDFGGTQSAHSCFPPTWRARLDFRIHGPL